MRVDTRTESASEPKGQSIRAVVLSALLLASSFPLGAQDATTWVTRLETNDPAAPVALLRLGAKARPALLRAFDADDAALAARATETLTAILLVERVREAKASDAAFWIAVDAVEHLASASLRDEALRLAIPKPARRATVRDRLKRATAVARRFCLEWNEISMNDAEVKRHAARMKALEAAGKPTRGLPNRDALRLRDDDRLPVDQRHENQVEAYA